MNYEQIEEELQVVLDDSLSPRGPELLFDYVADLGIDSNSTVLDLGCNMGKHSFELNRRFGCKVVGVDPGEDYIAEAMARAESDGVVDSSVIFRRGSGEAIPADDESFDLVWCRDVLELVSDLDTTYKEIGRVLKRKGRALVYTMCATDLLEPHEAERLYSGLDDVKAKSMLPSTHEEAISKSGLKIISSDVLGPEWGEFDQENTGKPARCLLQVARLLRSKEAFVASYGQSNYEIAVTDRLWHVYRMIGKLSGQIYLLEKTAT